MRCRMPLSSLPFSVETKEELAHLWPEKRCCQAAELAALVRTIGDLGVWARGAGEGRLLTFTTDQPAVARKVIRLMRHLFDLTGEVVVKRRRGRRKSNSYAVRYLPGTGVNRALSELGICSENGRFVAAPDDDLLRYDCCRRAYLRGTFLGAGWVSNPDRGNHLELSLPDPEYADAVSQLLFGYGLPVRLASRKDLPILYLKEGEQIAKFLNVVGAHQSLLKYEDVRALKDVKNQVNRLMNADAANLEKTIEASARQIEAIALIQRTIGLDRLPLPLKHLAEARLHHPEASLKELGEMLNPPVGKSGANHRMRALLKIADGLQN